MISLNRYATFNLALFGSVFDNSDSFFVILYIESSSGIILGFSIDYLCLLGMCSAAQGRDGSPV